LNDHRIDECNERMAGDIIDLAAKRHATGFEILDASKRIQNPKSVELDVVSGPVAT
jgi:hypothetical protein